MRIVLHCMAEPQADFKTRLSHEAYTAWESALKQAPAIPTRAVDNPGPGGPVLCSNTKAAVETAGRLFPDRRIEVKAVYSDPLLDAPKLPFKLKPRIWRRIVALAFLAGWQRASETPEHVKARMVETSTRLIGNAKEHDESHFVGEPLMIRWMSYKLNSIGFRGPLFGSPEYGSTREYEYLP